MALARDLPRSTMTALTLKTSVVMGSTAIGDIQLSLPVVGPLKEGRGPGEKSTHSHSFVKHAISADLVAPTGRGPRPRGKRNPSESGARRAFGWADAEAEDGLTSLTFVARG